MSDTPFVYKLNALEDAAGYKIPAQHSYAEKRLAVLHHVEELEREVAALREQIKRRDEVIDQQADDLSDAEILATVVRTGATPPEREWSDDTFRKTTLRAIELHQRAIAAEQQLSAAQDAVSRYYAVTLDYEAKLEAAEDQLAAERQRAEKMEAETIERCAKVCKDDAILCSGQPGSMRERNEALFLEAGIRDLAGGTEPAGAAPTAAGAKGGSDGDNRG